MSLHGLTVGIQEAVVALLCYDTAAAKQLRGVLTARSFGPYYREIVAEALNYVERYGSAPAEHVLDIVDQLKDAQPDRADTFDRIHASIAETQAEVNREYVLAKVSTFLRAQQLRAGAESLVDALGRDTEEGLAEAEAALDRMRTQNSQLFDYGLNMHDTARVMEFMDTAGETFLCGIPELDAYGLGPTRKRLHVFQAAPKKGKSYWLQHLGKMAVAQRLKVLYVTLELSELEVAGRTIQGTFSITKRPETVQHMEFTEDARGDFAFKEKKLKDRPSLVDKGARAKIAKDVDRFYGRRKSMVIKSFPTGKLTMKELESYLDRLEATGYIPDLLLVDYADLMANDGSPEQIVGIYRGLRGIAVQRNLAVATATQTNRGGAKVKTSDETDAEGAFGKAGICDYYITYNQTKAEKACGLARLFVALARTDESGFVVLLSQAYAMGQFVMSSRRMSPDYFAELEQWQEDDGGAEREQVSSTRRRKASS